MILAQNIETFIYLKMRYYYLKMIEWTKNEWKIIDLFRKNLFLKTSIRDISTKIKSKSYQRVYEAVQSLIKKAILSQEKVGNVNLISLNRSRVSFSCLSFIDETLPQTIPNSQKISEIKEISNFIVLVTGSYAKGTFTKKSDLDLVIVIPDSENVVHIQKLVENLTMLFIPEIHLYVFNKKDFLKMLLSKDENYGTEIFKHHIILRNAQNYYELINEAIDNGFKG